MTSQKLGNSTINFAPIIFFAGVGRARPLIGGVEDDWVESVRRVIILLRGGLCFGILDNPHFTGFCQISPHSIEQRSISIQQALPIPGQRFIRPLPRQ
jgi:hypothetical protein